MLRSRLTPYVYAAPLLLCIVAFVYWPLVYTFYLAVTKWNLVADAMPFVGTDNFRGVVTSSLFKDATVNTILYIVLAIPLKVILPIPIAVFLWSMTPRVSGVYKMIIFLPVLTSFVAVSVIWAWLLNPLGGYFGAALRLVGLTMPNLLFDTWYALLTIMGVSAWKILGFNTLIYTAGLASIDQEYIAAMRMDGASDYQIFRHLIIPLLAPTTVFVLVTTVIFTVQQVFTPIDIMTQGGPSNATTNLFYMVYQLAFRTFNIGYGAAATVILFVLLMIVTVLKFKLADRLAKYES